MKAILLYISWTVENVRLKNQYRLKVEQFKKWLLVKHPERFDADQKLDLSSVDKTVLKEFLGHICKKKSKDGNYMDPVVFHAFQHVSGYKSAIKDHYSNMDVKI